MTNKLSYKWIISFLAALVFLVVASPFMFRVSGSILGVIGLKTQTRGCPNWLGLIIHAIIFVCIVRLLMLIPLKEGYYEPDRGYQGLATPAAMMHYNTAYLAAQEVGCDECVRASEICMQDPTTEECSQNVQKCMKSCNNRNVTDSIATAQYLTPNTNYFSRGCCASPRAPI